MLALLAGYKAISFATLSMISFFTYSVYDDRPLRALQGYANAGLQLTLAAPEIIVTKIVSDSTISKLYHEQQSQVVVNTTDLRVPLQPLSPCWWLPVSEQGVNGSCLEPTEKEPELLYSLHVGGPPLIHVEIPYPRKPNTTDDLRVGFIALGALILCYTICRWLHVSAQEEIETERQLQRFWINLAGCLVERDILSRLENLRLLRDDVLDQIVFLTPFARSLICKFSALDAVSIIRADTMHSEKAGRNNLEP